MPAELPSMIKRHQILLLVPLALLMLGLLYRLNPFPNESKNQAHPTVVEASPSAVPTQPASFTDADFARHVEQLKTNLPSDEFSIVIQRPFVVIGDEPAEVVKE